jgi:hypothetical protein
MPIYTWKIKTQREKKMKRQWRISKNCGIIKEGIHVDNGNIIRKKKEEKYMKKCLKQ